ncbi:MAG TPA: diguanylate cyclase [Burkholderiaceae bacterium]|jgi:diguanylate cyclase (GGDEF)-like protein|nr:diguanylate cyclase [Burkholderiaceae bacterium]
MPADLPALDPSGRTWLPLDAARRLLIDTYPGIAIGLDLEGRVAWINPATVQRLGYGPQELAGRVFGRTSAPAVEPAAPAFAESVGADDGQPPLQALAAQDGAPEPGAWLLRDKDGLLRPTRLAIGLLRDGHGEAAGFLAVEPWPRSEADFQPEFVHHDPLTGLATRAVLPDRAEMALQRAARQKSVVALLLIELTGFEALCREHGRSVGEDLLRATAGRLYFEMRKTDTAVRLEDGRFAALLIDLHTPEEAQRVALKIRRALSAPANVGVGRMPVDARVGLAWFPDHGDQLLPLMEAAEGALARARSEPSDAQGVAAADCPTAP